MFGIVNFTVGSRHSKW